MSKFPSLIKKYPITSIVFVIILILITWWAWVSFSPKPLGDKMTYLGKRDYGNIFGFDSKPYSVYYYGTDMDEQEIADYFHSISSYEGIPPTNGHNGSFITIRGKRGDFYIRLFENTYAVDEARQTNFALSNKNIVTIVDANYDKAKQALQK